MFASPFMHNDLSEQRPKQAASKLPNRTDIDPALVARTRAEIETLLADTFGSRNRAGLRTSCLVAVDRHDPIEERKLPDSEKIFLRSLVATHAQPEAFTHAALDLLPQWFDFTYGRERTDDRERIERALQTWRQAVGELYRITATLGEGRGLCGAVRRIISTTDCSVFREGNIATLSAAWATHAPDTFALLLRSASRGDKTLYDHLAVDTLLTKPECMDAVAVVMAQVHPQERENYHIHRWHETKAEAMDLLNMVMTHPGSDTTTVQRAGVALHEMLERYKNYDRYFGATSFSKKAATREDQSRRIEELIAAKETFEHDPGQALRLYEWATSEDYLGDGWVQRTMAAESHPYIAPMVHAAMAQKDVFLWQICSRLPAYIVAESFPVTPLTTDDLLAEIDSLIATLAPERDSLMLRGDSKRELLANIASGLKNHVEKVALIYSKLPAVDENHVLQRHLAAADLSHESTVKIIEAANVCYQLYALPIEQIVSDLLARTIHIQDIQHWQCAATNDKELFQALYIQRLYPGSRVVRMLIENGKKKPALRNWVVQNDPVLADEVFVNAVAQLNDYGHKDSQETTAILSRYKEAYLLGGVASAKKVTAAADYARHKEGVNWDVVDRALGDMRIIFATVSDTADDMKSEKQQHLIESFPVEHLMAEDEKYYKACKAALERLVTKRDPHLLDMFGSIGHYHTKNDVVLITTYTDTLLSIEAMGSAVVEKVGSLYGFVRHDAVDCFSSPALFLALAHDVQALLATNHPQAVALWKKVAAGHWFMNEPAEAVTAAEALTWTIDVVSKRPDTIPALLTCDTLNTFAQLGQETLKDVSAAAADLKDAKMLTLWGKLIRDVDVGDRPALKNRLLHAAEHTPQMINFLAQASHPERYFRRSDHTGEMLEKSITLLTTQPKQLFNLFIAAQDCHHHFTEMNMMIATNLIHLQNLNPKLIAALGKAATVLVGYGHQVDLAEVLQCSTDVCVVGASYFVYAKVYDEKTFQTYRKHGATGTPIDKLNQWLDTIRQKGATMITHGQPLSAAQRAHPGYGYIVKSIFPPGNYSSYERNAQCTDHVDHLAQYTFNREGDVSQLSGLSGYALKRDKAAPTEVIASLSDRMKRIEAFIDDRSARTPSLMEDYNKFLDDLAGDVTNVSLSEKLACLLVRELNARGKEKSTEKIIDALALYKYVVHEDFRPNSLEQIKLRSRFVDESSLDYVTLNAASTMYGENMQHHLHQSILAKLPVELMDKLVSEVPTKAKADFSTQQKVLLADIVNNDEIPLDNRQDAFEREAKAIVLAGVHFSTPEDRMQCEREIQKVITTANVTWTWEYCESTLIPKLERIRKYYLVALGARLDKLIGTHAQPITTALAAYSPVLEVEAKERLLHGPKNVEVKKSAKMRNVRHVLMKTRESANASMGAYLCISGDMEKWDNPNYMERVMFDEDMESVGLAMYFRIDTDSGKKILWFGPNPYESFLAKVSSRQCYADMYQRAVEFAEVNNFDGIVVPAEDHRILGACTNRGGDFPEMIKESRLRDEAGNLKIVEFGRVHKLSGNYGYSSGALIWERKEERLAA